MSGVSEPKGDKTAGLAARILEKRAAIFWLVSMVLAIWVGSFFGGGPSPEPETIATSHTEELWYCAMHPDKRFPVPGKCPICEMDLIRAPTGAEGDGPLLTLSKAAERLAEVRTTPVRRKTVTAEIRLVGKVVYDETRLASITAWVPGRLDRLYVNYKGVPVRKGDHLVDIYSPELRTAQEELLLALRSAKDLQGSVIARESAEANVQAAREKLRLWGLGKEQILEIEQKGQTTDHITIHAPIGGIVVEMHALPGMHVETGDRIYTIADLTHLWVKLDAYESDLMWIRYGQDVEFRTEAYPGQVFHGPISFIDPVLDERTRTLKVRVNVESLDRRLKPGMFVRAIVRAQVAGAGLVIDPDLEGKWICPMHPEVVGDGPAACDICGMDLASAESLGYKAIEEQEPPLVIPTSAPLITGKRAVVYVKLPGADQPTFEGREVVLGPRAGDHYLVESGLEEGEEVVVQGAFKIDSALQIQAKRSMMAPPVDAPGSDGAKPKGSEEMGGVLDAYLEMHEALYASSATACLQAAKALRRALERANEAMGESDEPWVAIRDRLRIAIAPMALADELKGQRAALPALSRAIESLLEGFDWAGRPTVHRMHCPMAFGLGEGADWIQKDKKVLNPYWGKDSTMPHCGAIEEKYQAGGEE
ncbi:MAG: efflux RND transporter periplasmic adaptor subunit [Planctomycetota bacterium]|nr:efflux RND transporter periplasmic adaptor subunit [Planctomycetota bacterium]